MRLIFLLTIALSGLNSLCAQVPANDDCANAIAVNAGDVVTFDNTEATLDGPFQPSCVSSQNDTIWRDIWYVFTPAFTGYADWSLCNQALFDTKIAVYNAGAACPLQDSDLLDCNDDFGDCGNATSRIIFSVETGQSYLLRLGSWSATGPGVGGPGTFTIGELVTTVANDFCAQATPIFIGENQPVTNEGATTDGPVHPNNPCFQFNDNTIQADIWYTFTPNFTGSVIWSTCDQINFDSRLGVYQAGATCPLEDTDLMACNDDGSACNDYTSKLFFDVVAGETYLMRLGGWQGDQGIGTFDLLPENPPPPPANDACANADSAWLVTALMADEFENAIEGTTLNGTYDPDNYIFPNPACFAESTTSGEFSDVWYWFNSLGNTELEIRLIIPDLGQNYSFYAELFDGCDMMVDTSVIFNSCVHADTANPTVSTIVSGLLAEPTLYLLRVTTRLTSEFPGNFILFIVAENTTSANEKIGSGFPGRFDIAPNPASDQMHLNVLLAEPVEMNVRVLNAFGQQVLSKDAGKLSPGSHQLEFEVSDLAQGVYFVEIQSDKGRGTLRFLKQ